MSENIVKIPTWAIPLIVSLFIGAASYGAAQANAETTQKELDRVEKIVIETSKKSVENGTSTKLNEQAIKSITKNLTEMQETAKSSDAKLQKLVELLIAQSQK
jgi:septal ring factor EnvC (AmiA/AmiB activator)|tara:strand:- start:345 stop:653 length:309 start_codon:yes stop_codon:yes gene_type:complete